MNKIGSYLIAFLVGAIIILIGIVVYLLKNVKPVIVADTYIDEFTQAIRKIKQTGDGTIITDQDALKIEPKTEENKPPENLIEWIKQRRAKRKNKIP